MLRKEQNDLLTRTGPSTPMGALFRSYWLPALLASELPENECPPVRVKLLSERLIAWRDTDGRYSLIDEFCAHRGTSLWAGRNEEGGLRCPYHGWKYDFTGQCIEVPSEPVESGFWKKIKLKSYPLVKRGDVLWTYMGPPERQPQLPEFEFAMVPPEQSYISKRLQECNWLQALEGGIDSSHSAWLHRGEFDNDPLYKGAKGNEYTLGDVRPHFEVVESLGGLLIGARRNAEGGKYYWRITQWIMPNVTMIPPRGDYPAGGHFWVPIDDRTKENLVSTANGIIMARHRLMRAAKALVEKGETPPGVEPAHQRVRSVAIVLPPDQAFKDAAKEEMKVRPGLSHARV